jgi:hypothetical protein
VKKRNIKIGWTLLFTVIILFTAYIVIQYILVNPRLAGVVNAKLNTPEFPFKPWILVLYIHIFTGSLAFIVGPFQFLRKPVGKRAGRHRIFGYVYVLSIALAGMAGMYLSWFATGGIVSGLGFFMLDLLWLSTTTIALVKVLRKKFTSHRQWMIRSYAITLAFVTFRLYLIPFVVLFRMSMDHSINIASWLSWITNLIVIELYFKYRSLKKNYQLSV